jgi:Flp pilus assembly pilin Flp
MPPVFSSHIFILRRLIRSGDGQDIVEYALVTMMLSLALMAGLQSIAKGAANILTLISNNIP